MELRRNHPDWYNQADASAWHVLPTFTTLVNTVQCTNRHHVLLQQPSGKTVSFFAWARNQTTDQYGKPSRTARIRRVGNPPYIETTTLFA